MAEPFLAELRIMSFSVVPKGWAACNGQLLPINQNQALFSLLGTTYGGDGRVNFALPDLRGRTPIHFGNGFAQGERTGTETVTLTAATIPQHTHTMAVSSAVGTTSNPKSNILARAPLNAYASLALPAAMASATISNTGGSIPHLNMQPFLTLNICIALQGIFPSPN